MGAGYNDKLDVKAIELEAKLDNIVDQVSALEGLINNLNSKDYATQGTLAQVKSGIDTIGNKDFATEETLTAIAGYVDAVETKLDTIAGHVDGLESKIDALNNAIAAIKDTDGIKKIGNPLPAGTNNIGDVDIASLPSNVIAGMSSLPAGTNNIGDVDLASAIPAGDNTIGRVKLTDGTDIAQIDSSGNFGVNLNSRFDQIGAAPVVGVKTVTTSAAEIFAGGARLANRFRMALYNDSSITIYFGPSGVTTGTGFPLLPGDSVIHDFKPSTATPIYAIAASNASVRVVELA
jgi:outer membrane murein-binding lipoprotein Lpp